MQTTATLTLMLEAELERLKSLTDSGHQLRVAWLPQGHPSLSGEVKNDVILIYEEKSEKAIGTLRHEFIDYLVWLAIRPYEQTTVLYKAMLNGLLEKLGENAYLEKERVIEAISRVFSRDCRCEKGRKNGA